MTKYTKYGCDITGEHNLVRDEVTTFGLALDNRPLGRLHAKNSVVPDSLDRNEIILDDNQKIYLILGTKVVDEQKVVWIPSVIAYGQRKGNHRGKDGWITKNSLRTLNEEGIDFIEKVETILKSEGIPQEDTEEN